MEAGKLLKALRRSVAPLSVIIVAALLRLVPHPPNFAPIGGLALFSGARLEGKMAFMIPLFTMIASDAFLGSHGSMPYVYASFLLVVILGRMLKGKTHAGKLVFVAISSSVLFFIITNFGAWTTGTMYPKTAAGLMNAYILGIPFFRNTLVGDLSYSFAFFYGYDLARRYLKTANLSFLLRK